MYDVCVYCVFVCVKVGKQSVIASSVFCQVLAFSINLPPHVDAGVYLPPLVCLVAHVPFSLQTWQPPLFQQILPNLEIRNSIHKTQRTTTNKDYLLVDG